MNLKTYRAKTMADALSAVKKDLGDEAYILHTRTHKVGGVLGMLGRTIVEITASDAPPRRRKSAASRSAPRSAARPAPRPVAAAATKAYSNAGPPRTATPAQPTAAAAGPRSIDRSLDRSGRSGSTQKQANLARSIGAPPPADPGHDIRGQASESLPHRPLHAHAGQGSAGTLGVEIEPERMRVHRTGRPDLDRIKPSVEEEIASVKRMLAQVLHKTNVTAMAQPSASGSSQVGRMPDALGDQYLKLLEAMVAAEIADEVIGAVRDELSPAELADAEIVRQTVLRHLAAMIQTSPAISKAGRCEDGRPLTIALIGPTGVGKTTTVAKLAASYKLRHGRRIGLITSDTYRIAAVDQLRMYADIIGVPLKVATTPDDMATAVDSFRDRDVILIDSAGRSQRDRERIGELTALMDAARPHETHLVLAGNGSEGVLVEAVKNFGAANPNRVLFTKLDEAVNFGVLLNVARRVSLQLSYITTGQEVPDHIEVGRPDRLARLILEGPQAAGAAEVSVETDVVVGTGTGTGAGTGMGTGAIRA
ncbi:flagellar biosynthesis protein FlhF [Roseiflexus sp. AH-315-K22]|nr:flagellar biosynthesis protein FlhF [Roseiflexus sp. AH-315-K22]